MGSQDRTSLYFSASSTTFFVTALLQPGHLQAVYQIFGYLKKVPKRKLYFDPVSPSISEYRFHKFDWDDFYQDAKEAIFPRTVLKMQILHQKKSQGNHKQAY